MTFRHRRITWRARGVLLAAVFETTILFVIAASQAPPLPGTALIQQDSGTVSGRVLSKEGTPSSGIRVAALLVSPERAVDRNSPTNEIVNNGTLMSLAQTDSEGRYRLDNIAPGKYYLVAGPLDAPVYFPGVASQSSATLLTIASGTVMANVDFHLTAPLTVKVRGHVVREGHQAGSQIVLSRTGASFNTSIQSDGTFEFPAVRPGIYQARVSPGVSGLTALTVVIEDADIANLEIPIPLSAVDIAVIVNLTVEGGGVLPRFQLQLMPSGPLPANAPQIFPNFITTGRNVSIIGTRTQLTLPAQSFPQMEYRVRVFPSGNNGLPEGYIVKSITAGSVDLRTQPINVSAAMPTEIEIKLGVDSQPPWVRVKGQVTGIDASHPAPANIILEGPSSNALNASVRADGTFEFPAVLPGTYQARLTPSADVFFRPIVIQRVDPTILEIPLKMSSFTVTGRTTEVAPPNKFLRAILWPDPPGNSAVRPINSSVAADGSFAFATVQPGTYRATIAICESDTCGSTGGIVINVDRNISGLDVTRSEPPRTNIVGTTPVLVATNPVAGIVTMENGALMPRFRLKFTSNAVTRSVPIDRQSFTATLPNGDHRVAVADLPDGYVVRSIVDGASDLAFWPLSVTPTPNGVAVPVSPRMIAITLAVTSPTPWVKVSGRITGLSGNGARTAELTGKILVDPLKVPIGPDGSFLFPTVLPDTYTLRLLPTGNSAGHTITVGTAGLESLQIDAALLQ